jgi:hypothetical protein
MARIARQGGPSEEPADQANHWADEEVMVPKKRSSPGQVFRPVFALVSMICICLNGSVVYSETYGNSEFHLTSLKLMLYKIKIVNLL